MPGTADIDIFPREVRPSILRVLWLGLFAVLGVLVVLMLAWRTCAA